MAGNPIPTRFLAQIDCSKISAQVLPLEILFLEALLNFSKQYFLNFLHTLHISDNYSLIEFYSICVL
jgi:hypothetical protein